MLRIHHRIHQGKLTDFSIRNYKRRSEARKNPHKKKTPREMGKNRGNLGRNKAKQKPPRPSYEAEKITIINENTHIIYIDKFIERRYNFNRVKRYF